MEPTLQAAVVLSVLIAVLMLASQIGYGLDGKDSMPNKEKNFSVHHLGQTGSEPMHSPDQEVPDAFSAGVNRLKVFFLSSSVWSGCYEIICGFLVQNSISSVRNYMQCNV
jgi:hypothetical protein